MAMRINNSPPCHGCEDRICGCHAKCERFKAWKQEFQKKKEALEGHQMRERMLNDFYVAGVEKQIKKSGRRV